MSAANINIRIEPTLKRQFEALCSDLGMSMTTAFTVFAKQAVRENGIPFWIGGKKRSIPPETLEALEEVRAIEEGRIKPKIYTSVREAFEELDEEYEEETKTEAEAEREVVNV